MDLFVFKKLVAAFVTPLVFVLVVMLFGLIALWRKKWRAALTLHAAATLLLLAFTLPQLPNTLLAPKEQQYRQFDQAKKVQRIVVLGCGHHNDGALPITSQMADCSAKRLIEAVRIYRLNPGSRIIASGYGGNQPFSNAQMYQRLATALGVPKRHVTVIGQARDTAEEAALLGAKLKGFETALVTSASHMPRAMALFAPYALNITAAPTDHLVKDNSAQSWWSHTPSSRNLAKIERWWYESLASAWVEVKRVLLG